MIKFSVLLTVWQKDDSVLFSKAVESIYSNTVSPTEVILVIDGPVFNSLKDTILALCLKYDIKYFYLNKNVGLAKALNFGLSKCSFPWVFRADADDINDINRFKYQIDAIIANPSIKLIGGFISEFDENLNTLNVRKVPLTYNDILLYVKYRNPFNHMTVAYKKDVILNVGGYPDIYLREDYALWAAFLRNNEAMNIPVVLVYASAGDGLIRRRGGLKYAFHELFLQIFLYRCRHKNLFNAFFIFIFRFFIFIGPFSLRKYIYKFFLRN